MNISWGHLLKMQVQEFHFRPKNKKPYGLRNLSLELCAQLMQGSHWRGTTALMSLWVGRAGSGVRCDVYTCLCAGWPWPESRHTCFHFELSPGGCMFSFWPWERFVLGPLFLERSPRLPNTACPLRLYNTPPQRKKIPTNPKLSSSCIRNRIF